MKSKSELFEGGVEKISTLADGSLRVHIGTPELSDETMVNLFKMNRKTGYVLLSPYPVNKDQQEAVEKASSSIEHESTEFGNKTPSQRLRNVFGVPFADRSATVPLAQTFITSKRGGSFLTKKIWSLQANGSTIQRSSR